jgi:transposase
VRSCSSPRSGRRATPGLKRRGRRGSAIGSARTRGHLCFYGGVAAMTVSDNLKSGITKACFYDPEVNRSCAEMAAHYGTAIVPARPCKPRD